MEYRMDTANTSIPLTKFVTAEGRSICAGKKTPRSQCHQTARASINYTPTIYVPVWPNSHFENDPDEQQLFGEVLRQPGTENEALFHKCGEELFNYLRTITDKPFMIVSDINSYVINGIAIRKTILAAEYLRKKASLIYSIPPQPTRNVSIALMK